MFLVLCGTVFSLLDTKDLTENKADKGLTNVQDNNAELGRQIELSEPKDSNKNGQKSSKLGIMIVISTLLDSLIYSQ